MAEEIDDQSSSEASTGKSRFVPILVVLALMVGEGVGITILIKAISPAPVVADAAEADGEGGDVTSDGSVEIELAECRPSNRLSGKFVTFHIRVSALVPEDQYDFIEDLVRARKARIEDGVNTVIRSAEPKQLSEPGLDTLKRHLKKEFDRILGDDQLIQEVLVPQLLESR